MSAIGPLAEQLGEILAQYTPEQIAALIDAAVKMQPKTTPPAATPAKRRSKKTAVSKVAQQTDEAKLDKSINTAPSRPLNSFLAYRSYYASIFKKYQQKNISGHLRRMWTEDPFKAKWSIVAKAYSMIREHEAKDDAPLSEFLTIACPRIGIISKENYLAVMGWVITEDQDEKKMVRRFEPDFTTFGDDILVTNMSADDVVAFAAHSKYIDQSTGAAIEPSSPTRVQMVAASLAQVLANNPAQVLDTAAAQAVAAGPPLFVGTTQAQAMASATDAPVVPKAVQTADKTVETTYMPQIIDRYTPGSVAALQQTLFDFSDQEYPFYDGFDPLATETPTPTWNPLVGNPDIPYDVTDPATYLPQTELDFPSDFDIDEIMRGNTLGLFQ
ncbi:hypothetical protein AAFC00_005754 [Neodothiora populina]|uniref:Mating-type protein MAT-1 n=1 Tax=Neodothiora populina TaxID=2781224 RepID=A0ABR3P5R2_9PEZI